MDVAAKKKPGRGGRRAGAGRPALPEAERLQARTVRLSDDHLARLEALAREGESWRDVLRRLVEGL